MKTFSLLNVKHRKKTIIFGLIALLLGSATFIIFVLKINAIVGKKGSEMGTAIGTTAGRALGSLTGMTDGINEGYEFGKNDGLSAKDTTVTVSNALKGMGNLEVLIASVKIGDVHSVGEDYKALYLANGNAVFSININEAEVEEKENTLYILLPQPEMALRVNQDKIKQIAVYQKGKYTGKAEDGFDAYVNSLVNVLENSKEAISNYDSLVENARKVGQQQVKQLAEAMMLKEKTVVVQFKQEE